MRIRFDEWMEWQLNRERSFKHHNGRLCRKEVRLNQRGGREYAGVVEVLMVRRSRRREETEAKP